MKKLILINIFFCAFLTACSSQNNSETSDRNWTLIGSTEDGRSNYYIDFDAIALKSPGIYSFDELYDSTVPFEAIRNDGREVKSMISHNLVNCSNGTMKNGSFTAYYENMGKGILNFEGKSALQNWMGGSKGSITNKIFQNICFPEVREKNLDERIKNNNQSKSDFMHELPIEQKNFLDEFNKISIISQEDLGTKDAEFAENQIYEFKSKIVSSEIKDWICKVSGSDKFDDIYSIYCSINFTLNSDNLEISFDSPVRFYKNNIIKITGIVSKESIFNNKITKSMLIFVHVSAAAEIN